MTHLVYLNKNIVLCPSNLPLLLNQRLCSLPGLHDTSYIAIFMRTIMLIDTAVNVALIIYQNIYRTVGTLQLFKHTYMHMTIDDIIIHKSDMEYPCCSIL